MKGYVYVLKSLKDSKSYIGSTLDVLRRLNEHNSGHVKSTKHRLPFILNHVIEYESLNTARLMERKFKKSHDILRRVLLKTEIIQSRPGVVQMRSLATIRTSKFGV